MAYKTLVDQDQLTPENLRKAQYLGWCVEMVSFISNARHYGFQVYLAYALNSSNRHRKYSEIS